MVSGAVGLLAIFVAAYTVYVQRQQLKVQAWPRLALEYDLQSGANRDESQLTLSLTNRGFAPAEVRQMHVVVGGTKVTNYLD